MSRGQNLALDRLDIYTAEQEPVGVKWNGWAPLPAQHLRQRKAAMRVPPSHKEAEIAKLLERLQFRTVVRRLFVGQTLAKRSEVEITPDDQGRNREALRRMSHAQFHASRPKVVRLTA